MTGPSCAIPIIVVSWNHLEQTTAPCLRSLRRFTGGRYRVLCVDNGSTDGTCAWLQRLSERDPRFQAILLPENRGWNGGTLEGLAHVSEQEPCVCLLNSDTLVTPRWLDKLRAHLFGRADLSAVIPHEIPLPVRGSSEKAPRLAGAVPLEEPGTLPPAAPALLDQVLAVAAEVERRFAGRTVPGMPSGFCALVKRQALPLLRRYLRDFERYRRGELDVNALFKGQHCRIALDTYVFHARGGSGGYYDYRDG